MTERYLIKDAVCQALTGMAVGFAQVMATALCGEPSVANKNAIRRISVKGLTDRMASSAAGGDAVNQFQQTRVYLGLPHAKDSDKLHFIGADDPRIDARDRRR